MSTPTLPRVVSVNCLSDYIVRLRFTDGLVREVDLGPYLRGSVFERVREPEFFRRVKVDEELGTIVWPNGADIDPDVLHGDFEPAWMVEAASEDSDAPPTAAPNPANKKRSAKPGANVPQEEQ